MVRRIVAVIVCLVAAVLVIFYLVMPRLNLGANQKPGSIETWLARRAVGMWIAHNAGDQPNPIPADAADLKLGEKDFNEHCGGCHGLDGGGGNELEADFYPPVPRLTGAIQRLSDAQLYFIIANGIRLSGMPAFAGHHDGEEIWRMVGWVRHLAHLSPAEKAAIEAAIREHREAHEQVMREGGADGQHD